MVAVYLSISSASVRFLASAHLKYRPSLSAASVLAAQFFASVFLLNVASCGLVSF